MTSRPAIPCTAVENGRRIAFDLAADGKAAIVTAAGITTLAYAPKERKAKLPEVDAALLVDGEAFRIVKAKELSGPRLFRLVIAPVVAEAPE